MIQKFKNATALNAWLGNESNLKSGMILYNEATKKYMFKTNDFGNGIEVKNLKYEEITPNNTPSKIFEEIKLEESNTLVAEPVTTADLENYAEKSDLAEYAKESDLATKADQVDLDTKADRADLDSKVDISELENYAEKSELENYATLEDVPTLKFWTGSEDDYNALATPDEGTLYIIK